MSKLSITFQFDSEAEALVFLAGIQLPPAAALPVEIEAEKAVKVRRTTTKKAEVPAAMEAGVVVERAQAVRLPGGTPVLPAPAPKALAADSPTQEDVRAALRTVFNSKGASAATELLKKFNATSISTIKPENYAAFVEACA